MKRLCSLVLPLVLIAVPGCSSSQAGKGTAASAQAEAATRAKIDEENSKAVMDAARRMVGAPENEKGAAVKEEPWIIVTDEATGKKLQRIPKSPTMRVEGGKLRHTLLNPLMFSLDLVREDEKYYYVDAPDETARSTKVPEKAPEGLEPIVEVPPGEYEVVTPKVSRTRLRFEEKSAGLPTGGFWRSNMDVADLLGDGSIQIVTPPPRLAGGTFRVFKFDGTAWQPVKVQVDPVEEGLRFMYGGVAVADMDGDGKLDVIGIGHGTGPVVAYNLGGGKFRLESRGLPREMSGRSVGIGDVDGDGRPDIVAVSDEPEANRTAEYKDMSTMYGTPADPAKENADSGAYKKGFDMRAFFAQPDGTFRESTAGLEKGCFGYSMSLAAPAPAGGGAPFFVSGCRYQGGRALLYEWDAAAKSFRSVGRGVVEEFSFHSGAAVGTYHGFPAAFSSYVKGNAPGAVVRPIRGQGVSVYYRDGDGWKAKRVVKALADSPEESQGLGVGDLNGDGLDDIAWADDSVGRIRIFLQTPAGEFEELDPSLEPTFVNHSMSLKIVDVDRDGKKDLVLMYEFRTTDSTRAGGLRFFRNLG